VLVSGASTSLFLGTSGNPLHLTIGDDLGLASGATLEVRFGSDVTANDFGSTGVNGTLRVDGSGSTLMLTGAALSVVGNSGTGSLIFQNGSTGNSITNTLGLADTLSAGAAGTLTISGGSTLLLDGDLRMAQRDVAGQSATLNISGAASALTQTGANSMIVGAAANGTAAINIGATATGGTLTTGTGTLTINPTGTVSIGNGANTGTLNVNGDVVINDGVLERGQGSTFFVAPGKSITIQNGGRATLNGFYATGGNDINISGANSRLETIGAGMNISNGAQVSVTSGGSIVSAQVLQVGIVGVGTLMVDGPGSSVSASNQSIFGHSGGTANVTFSNHATGSFPNIQVIASSTAGTSANFNVLSGADVSLTATMAIGTLGGATTGVMAVDGAGSTFGADRLHIGHESQGTGTLNVTNGAVFTNGASEVLVDGTGVINISSAVFNTSGPIQLNNVGGTGTLSRINVNGAGGNLTQTGASTITVGQTSGGTAAINIGTTSSGGTLTTGTGLFTINATGTVTVGSGANTGTLFCPGRHDDRRRAPTNQ
jgi:T5SS/PEP-CTERM-associated repeat protein